MPMKPRDLAIQEYKRATKSMESTLFHLSKLRKMYGDGYEEHNNAVGVLIQAQVQVSEFLTDFRAKHM